MMEPSDLTLLVKQVLAEGASPRAELRSGPFRGAVVRVAPGERLEHTATAPTLVVVMAGVGTLTVEDWRATVLAGHTLGVGVGQAFVLVADGVDACVVSVFEAPVEAAAGVEATPPDVT